MTCDQEVAGSTAGRTLLRNDSGQVVYTLMPMSPSSLFHDLLLRSYLYHCVWSVITAHNLTPEKRDSNVYLNTV